MNTDGTPDIEKDPWAITPPDWGKWLGIKNGKLWQAAALACNYDPANFNFFNEDTLCPIARRPSDFAELLNLAKNNLGGKLKATTINKGALEESEVSLQTFYSWLKATGYDLPPELVGHVGQKAASLTDEQSLGERERTTLLTLIAALAHEAGIDISKPSKAAGLIEGLTTKIEARIAARTIEEHLKRIPGALEKRSS